MNLRKEDEGQAGEGQAWQNQFWPSPFVVPIWDQSSTQGSTPFPFKLLKRGITERKQSLDIFNPPALTVAPGVLEKEMPKGLHASIFISSLPWRDFCAAPVLLSWQHMARLLLPVSAALRQTVIFPKQCGGTSRADFKSSPNLFSTVYIWSPYPPAQAATNPSWQFTKPFGFLPAFW